MGLAGGTSEDGAGGAGCAVWGEAFRLVLTRAEEREAKAKAAREAEAAALESARLAFDSDMRRRKAFGNMASHASGAAAGLPKRVLGRHDCWAPPRGDVVYLCPKGEGRADVAADMGRVYSLGEGDASIEQTLRLAKARWPGGKIRLHGDPGFKARARALAAELKLGIEFAPEPESERPVDRPGPRMRM